MSGIVDPQQAADLLVRATPNGNIRKVVLFGSRARGSARPDSDIDLVVIEREVGGRAKEYVRLRRALKPIRSAFDLLIYSEKEIAEWGDMPGTAMYDALTEGKVLFDAELVRTR